MQGYHDKLYQILSLCDHCIICYTIKVFTTCERFCPLLYPLPVACFLNIPYPLIGPKGMLTPRSVPSATVPGPMLGSVYLMSRPRCHFTTPYLSTCLGSVHLGRVGSPRTWFGG